MANKKKKDLFAALTSENAALKLACVGLAFILAGNAFKYSLLKIDIDVLLVNIGALLLVVGVLQWLFDTYSRQAFFNDVRSEIIGDRGVSESGICNFLPDSTDIDFEEYFLTSSSVTMGLNYSAKLIDNSIELLRQRTADGKYTRLLVVNQSSSAADFLSKEYSSANISASLKKIAGIVAELDPSGALISILEVPTILRYSFVRFDSKIWIIVGTNGLGRRAVPGFFVRANTPWHDHFDKDINLLIERAV